MNSLSNSINSLESNTMENKTNGNKNLQNHISLKLSRILSTSYGDSGIFESLEYLSNSNSFSNSTEDQRKLRCTAQINVLEANRKILLKFSNKIENLRNMEHSIQRIQCQLLNMEKEAIFSNNCLKPLVKEASCQLSQEIQFSITKSILEAFEKKFLISKQDIEILISNSFLINFRFFKILEKVKNVYNDTDTLLIGDNQKLGLEILHQLTELLDKAFFRLHKFTERELTKLPSENVSLEQRNILRQCLITLSERPTLFQSTLEYLISIRQKSIQADFIKALTVENKKNRPIELHAHDPLRYIGDMLAWIHSAAVSELEALDMLIPEDGVSQSLKVGLEAEPWTNPLSLGKGIDINKIIFFLVDENLKSAVRILSSRIEQVIVSLTSPKLAYEVSSLIGFYQFTIAKSATKNSSSDKFLLNDDDDDENDKPKKRNFSGLINNIFNLFKASVDKFFILLDDQFTILKGDATIKDELTIDWIKDKANLQPPEFLFLSAQDTKEILTAMDEVPTVPPLIQTQCFPDDSSAFTPDKVLNHSFYPYLELALSPVKKYNSENNNVDIIENNAYEKIEEKNTENCLQIYQLNCIDVVKNTLILFPSLSEKSDSLMKEEKVIIQKLIENLHLLYISASGIKPMLDTINKELPEFQSILRNDDFTNINEDFGNSLVQTAAISVVLKDNLLFSQSQILNTSQQLDEFLSSSLLDANDSFKKSYITVDSLPVIDDLNKLKKYQNNFLSLSNISSPRHLNEIISNAKKLFLHDFYVVYIAIHSLYSQNDITEFFPRSVNDVKTLIGI